MVLALPNDFDVFNICFLVCNFSSIHFNPPNMGGGGDGVGVVNLPRQLVFS